MLIRLGGLSLGSSQFTFSIVVATFVLCIALGSFGVALFRRVRPGAVLVALWAALIALALLYLPLQDGPYWAYRLRILPKARESLDLVRVGYQNGDPKYNFTALLQAQQILFQAELSYVQALSDLWRAVADLEGLLQRQPE